MTGVTILASACGMAFNVVADPLVGYFYKMYLLGVPQDISKALAKISTVTTGVNAIVAVDLCFRILSGTSSGTEESRIIP